MKKLASATMKMVPIKKPSVREIQMLAYKLWEEDGSPESDGAEYWLKAEEELNNSIGKFKKEYIKKVKEKLGTKNKWKIWK